MSARAPQLRLGLEDEIIVDQFAGGGGASLGIEMALGRSPDVAINHDPEAIALHAANHPLTRHFCESVWDVDPVAVCAGRPVGFMWLSPDCKHFSKAKGGKPVEKNIRGLAWIAIKWAHLVAPRVIVLENVEEFKDWGPLTADNMPCPLRRGDTFKRWKRALKRAGYAIEHRELRAADYGVPTIRRRLFLIARRDGLPIRWPEQTHFDPRQQQARRRLLPWRSAAECIDWSIACPSIFERARDLAPNTLRRIAAGIQRYVVESASPFIVPVLHAGDRRVHALAEPLRTITGQCRGEHALAVPYVAPMVTAYHGIKGKSAARGSRVDAPQNTQTCDPRFGLVAASLVEVAHGEISPSGVKRRGKGHHDIVAPLGTVVASGGNAALVAASLINTRNGEREGQAPRVRDIRGPAPTVTAIGSQGGVVAAFLAQHNTGMVGHRATEPVSTIIGKGCTQAVVASHLTKLYGSCKDGVELEAPMPTVTAGGWHVGEVRAFLMKYHRDGGQLAACDEPMHTVSTRARMGLVTVRGELFQIVDIGMRMLAPRELYRAQGFSDDYKIEVQYDAEVRGKMVRKVLSKTAQIRMCGNSVCPGLAEAIVRANFAFSQRLGVAA